VALGFGKSSRGPLVDGKRKILSYAHRTITVSEEAYRALSERKDPGESFTEAIIRLVSERGEAAELLALIRSMEADEELAVNVE